MTAAFDDRVFHILGYARTPPEHSPQEPFGHLYDWTVEHMDGIVEHQRRYDGLQSGDV